MRYIIDCRCESPFISHNWEFATVHIKGQSFMMHQIRKMIGMCMWEKSDELCVYFSAGLVVAIMRGYADKSIIQRAWEAEHV